MRGGTDDDEEDDDDDDDDDDESVTHHKRTALYFVHSASAGSGPSERDKIFPRRFTL